MSALTRPLEALASEINAAHREARQYASKAIERALQAGALLIEAKARVSHGEWLPWLAANCPDISPRTCSSYMRLAKGLPQIGSASDLTVRGALRLLDPPEPASSPLHAVTDVISEQLWTTMSPPRRQRTALYRRPLSARIEYFTDTRYADGPLMAAAYALMLREDGLAEDEIEAFMGTPTSENSHLPGDVLLLAAFLCTGEGRGHLFDQLAQREFQLIRDWVLSVIGEEMTRNAYGLLKSHCLFEQAMTSDGEASPYLEHVAGLWAGNPTTGWTHPNYSPSWAYIDHTISVLNMFTATKASESWTTFMPWREWYRGPLTALREIQIPIASIHVESYRKDMGDIDTLAASIEAQGLFQPIGVTPDYQLIFGSRRLEACRRLGWNIITTRVIKMRNRTHLLQMRIAENEDRKRYTVRERVEYAETLESTYSPEGRT